MFRQKSFYNFSNDETSLPTQDDIAIETVSGLIPHPKIVVVGVGGAGTNAVNRMIEAGIHGVEYIALNTDMQVLKNSLAPTKVCLGKELTNGLGAGSKPTVGAKAAEESADEIVELLTGADMVFITAGMGGGTGTGAATVIGSIAQHLGALTVAVATMPFTFEGMPRRKAAEEGAAKLKESVDATIIIPNDKLLHAVNSNISLDNAFRVADDVLRQGVQGIAEVITVPGLINVDFADVRAVLSQAGTTIMSIGEGFGEDRAIQAAQAVIAGGWLDTSIKGASRLMLNITGGPDMSLFEATEIASEISNAVATDSSVDLVFGAVVDEHMEGYIRATLIAAGINDETHQVPAKPQAQQTVPSESRFSPSYSWQASN